MLEVIYRIYEMIDPKRDRFNGGIREVTMNCKVCDTREQFKELIKEEWGNIPFARTKKLGAGGLYCVIIGEHCFNTERFFIKKNFECSYCHTQMEGFYGKPVQFSNSEIKFELFGLDKYKVEKFCCSECKNARIEQLHRQLQQGCEDIEDYWITKDMFEKEQQGILGYIYKITKRSTGEFYIGQTQSVPVFRWGQHLKTDRFDLKGIQDYIFEVLYIVRQGENILEVEKGYIQRYCKENPELCLNIMCTKAE